MKLEVVLRDSTEDGLGVSFGDGSLDLELKRVGVGVMPGSVEAVSSGDRVEREEGPELLGGGRAAEEGEGREEDESDGERPPSETGRVLGVLEERS